VDRAIDFQLPDHQGRPWHLSEEVRRGPVLVVFYRGDW
jgi:peroxiredoxin